jgi:hypothetical protein
MPVIEPQPTISWTDFVTQAKSGDLLLFSETDSVGKTIEAFTGGPFAHAAMVYQPDAGSPLELWESNMEEIAPDVIVTSNDCKGAQCGDLLRAVNVIVKAGDFPYYRQLTFDRPPEFDNQLLQAILSYDGHTLFGGGDNKYAAIALMMKNYIEGHYFNTAGPAQEVYCAELVAMTYVMLGLMSPSHPPNYYSPASFSTYKDDVVLLQGSFVPQIQIDVNTIPPWVPPSTSGPTQSSENLT